MLACFAEQMQKAPEMPEAGGRVQDVPKQHTGHSQLPWLD